MQFTKPELNNKITKNIYEKLQNTGKKIKFRTNLRNHASDKCHNNHSSTWKKQKRKYWHDFTKSKK